MPFGLGWSVTVFFFTALLTWGWTGIARARQIHDEPERRRLHRSLVPRAGGISIAIAMSLATLLLMMQSEEHAYWPVILLAVILYSAIGFWDDLRPARAATKLFLHLLATAIVFFAAMHFPPVDPLTAAFLAIAYLACVNIWNFMDGSNGMIAMQSLCMTIGVLALGYYPDADKHYGLTLAACCLGFLPFNFPTARVFAGDVGSHALGAGIAGLCLLAYAGNQMSFPEIACLTSALWIDAVLTFARRAIRGFNVMQAHRSHLYQYLVRTGKSHAAVCWYYAAWTAGMIFLIGFLRQLPMDNPAILLWTIIGLACGVHQWLRLFVLKSVRSPKKVQSQ